mmetsp:Transcript_106781/g.184188  ORF Transcript_106781/g.184188 Transcript_106781/m.184188 type:complete len:272 (-) Transcript_106781:1011-1826(-)
MCGVSAIKLVNCGVTSRMTPKSERFPSVTKPFISAGIPTNGSGSRKLDRADFTFQIPRLSCMAVSWWRSNAVWKPNRWGWASSSPSLRYFSSTSSSRLPSTRASPRLTSSSWTEVWSSTMSRRMCPWGSYPTRVPWTLLPKSTLLISSLTFRLASKAWTVAEWGTLTPSRTATKVTAGSLQAAIPSRPSSSTSFTMSSCTSRLTRETVRDNPMSVDVLLLGLGLESLIETTSETSARPGVRQPSRGWINIPSRMICCVSLSRRRVRSPLRP